MSLSGTLATAARSLELFSTGLQISGNNISNAGTAGYVRDELRLETGSNYLRGNLVFGTGSQAASLRQQLDRYLESRIHSANSDLGAADARSTAYESLQRVLNELTDQDLSTGLNEFVGKLNELATQPEDVSRRLNVVSQGERFASDIYNTRKRIDELRDTQSQRVVSLTEEANGLLDQVSNLNDQIRQLEFGGLSNSQAGALRTNRLNALQRLSEIVPIRAVEGENSSVAVYLGNEYLILQGSERRLENYTEGKAGLLVTQVRVKETHASIPTTGGELAGAVEGRDQILGGFVESLDKLTGAFIESFNRQHSSGEGLAGYTAITGTNRIEDATAALNAAGLSFTPNHGSFQVKLVNTTTGLAETANIAIKLDGIGTQTTLNSLVSSLDGLAHLSASVDTQGKIQLAADAGYEFRFANDTSGALAALGVNTFFTGSDSGSIGINSELKENSQLLATGQGSGPADGRNIVKLAVVGDVPQQQLGGLSVQGFHSQLVGAIAQGASAETALLDGFTQFRDSLSTEREQKSGVSLDEEAIRVLQLQRNYQAAAKIVTTVDQLFQTLLQI